MTGIPRRLAARPVPPLVLASEIGDAAAPPDAVPVVGEPECPVPTGIEVPDLLKSPFKSSGTLLRPRPRLTSDESGVPLKGPGTTGSPGHWQLGENPEFHEFSFPAAPKYLPGREFWIFRQFKLVSFTSSGLRTPSRRSKSGIQSSGFSAS